MLNKRYELSSTDEEEESSNSAENQKEQLNSHNNTLNHRGVKNDADLTVRRKGRRRKKVPSRFVVDYSIVCFENPGCVGCII